VFLDLVDEASTLNFEKNYLMRRLLYILFLLGSFTMKLHAQCIPDTTIQNPGITPQPLPHARIDSVYNQVVQFKFPKDTVITVKIVFDSLRLIKVDSAPAFLSYQCNIDSGFSACTWLGGGNGCVTFSGSPQKADVGKYRIKVTLKAFFKLFGNPTNKDFSNYLDFYVDDTAASNVGINQKLEAAGNNGGNYPNPFTDKTDIIFSVSKAGNATVQVYDALGNKIYKTEVITKAGENKVAFDGSSLNPGLYIYSVCVGKDCITRRMLKN
jgi:hypothetical protein